MCKHHWLGEDYTFLYWFLSYQSSLASELRSNGQTFGHWFWGGVFPCACTFIYLLIILVGDVAACHDKNKINPQRTRKLLN